MQATNSKPLFTGTRINYFFICHRKLWLFANGLGMEQESDLVSQGRFLHEHSYERKQKEIKIDNIVLDFFEKKGEVHEVKKSRKAEKAHEWQMLYYLYCLKQKGLNGLKGIIDYALLRKRKKVFLTEEKEKDLLKVLKKIQEILAREKPPKEEWKRFCRKCSYREFCWS